MATKVYGETEGGDGLEESAITQLIDNRLLGESLGSLMAGEIEYFANLPDVAASNGSIYRVLKRTANYWTLGMTSRHLAGFYESDGTTWNLKPNAALPVYNPDEDDRDTTNYRSYTPVDLVNISGVPLVRADEDTWYYWTANNGTPDDPLIGDWRTQQQEGNPLTKQTTERFNVDWELVQSLGGSVKSDSFVIFEGNHGFSYQNADTDHIQVLLNIGSDESSTHVGNVHGPTRIFSDSAPEVIKYSTEDTELVIQADDDVTLELPWVEEEGCYCYKFDHIEVVTSIESGVSIWIDASSDITDARLHIGSTLPSGAQGINNTPFANFIAGEGDTAVIGENIIDWEHDFPTMVDITYVIFIRCTKPVIIQGTMIEDTFIPKLTLRSHPTELRPIVSLPKWTSGTDYSAGTWIYEGYQDFPGDPKFYKCITSGVQTDTFASNSTLWREIGEGSPGRITSPDTLKDLILTDDDLIYYDAGNNRLLVNSTISGLISPDGTKMVSVSDAGVFYGGDEVAIVSDLHSKSEIVSPDGLKDLILTDTSLTYQDNVRDRLVLNESGSYLYDATGTAYMRIDNDDIYWYDDNRKRFEIKNLRTKFISPNGTDYLMVKNDFFEWVVGVNVRMSFNDTYSAIFSPDANIRLLVNNSGAFYDGAEILTVSDAGVSIAELVDGVVPEGQLPSYLDDVINKYLDIGDTKSNGYDAFYDEVELTNKTAEATGIIYIDVTAGGNTSYRWSGTAYTALNSGIVLGETSATAYRGDRGKIAYDHSLESHDYATVSHVHELIESPDSVRSLTITDSVLTYEDDTTNRLYISDIISQLTSPDGNTQIQVDNDGFYILDNGIIRLDQNATSSVFKSPDGAQVITIDDTGAYYNGVELLTSGGSGTGDVVGPDESIDYRVPTFDGTTGKLLKQSLVSISGTGVMLGVTSLTVDDIRINDNLVEAIGTDTTLLLKGSGTGGIILNDVIGITDTGNISGVNQLIVDLMKFDGATITTLGTNANLFINPNGTGYVNILANLVVNNKIGIGVSSPAANMHTKGGSEHLRMQGTIAGDGEWQSWYTSGGARRGYFGFGSTSLDIITLNNEAGTDIDIKAGGNKVRLYCNSGTSGLKSPNGSTIWVSDTVSYTPRAWTVGSDRTLKDNITPLSNEAIDFIDGLKPVSYNYKTNIDSIQLGFIAQDVEEIQMSDMVSVDEDGMKGVAYTEIIAPLVAYVQKLEKRLADLEANMV